MSPLSTAALPLYGGVRAATVVGVHPDARVDVRLRAAAEPSVTGSSSRTERHTAMLAQIAGYRPAEGDRVLVAQEGAQHYVIAVLCARARAGASVPPGEEADATGVREVSPSFELSDGARAELVAGGLELRDGDGNLLVVYRDGNARVCAPRRDLELSAPAGRVKIDAALDVSIEAARDLVARGGRSLELEAAGGEQAVLLSAQRTHVQSSRLHVDANESRLATSRASLIARSLSTTAERVAVNVDRYELQAKKLVEHTRDVFRTALGLAQTKVGRSKNIVGDSYSLHARRTVIVSKADTSIDGERVLLG